MDLYLPEKDVIFCVKQQGSTLAWPYLEWLSERFLVICFDPLSHTRIDQQAAQSGARLLLIDASFRAHPADTSAKCLSLHQNACLRHLQMLVLVNEVDPLTEMFLYDSGVTEIIERPSSKDSFLRRISARLSFHYRIEVNEKLVALLDEEIEKRVREIAAVQDVSILALTSLAEKRDSETGNHLRRTQRYVKTLAQQLRLLPKYAHKLDDKTIEMLYKSAPLHDIGKVGIPDSILLKPGKLTPQEMVIMKTHTTLGRDAIQQAEEMLGTPAEYLRIAKEIAYSHQEKWDGSGYPEGFKGEEIPLSARLMSLADVYDALISRRVYREKMATEAVEKIILEGRGTHFDPDVVDAFVQRADEFRRISETYADIEGGSPDKPKVPEVEFS